MSELLNTETNAVQSPVVEGSGNAVDAAHEPVVEVQGAQGQTQEPPAQETTKAPQTREESHAAAAVRKKMEAEMAQAVQKAKDEAAAALAKRFNLSTPEREIKTFDDFDNFGLELELKNAEVDPAKYKALRENDPEVRKAKEILATQEKQAKDLKAFGAFRAAFKEANGREFDITQDATVYAEVKQEADESGKDMTDVFARHHNKTLMSRLAELEAKLTAQETNKANAASSPGSVKEGIAATPAITQEDIDAHANDTQWAVKNYDKILDFLGKKKG